MSYLTSFIRKYDVIVVCQCCLLADEVALSKPNYHTSDLLIIVIVL